MHSLYSFSFCSQVPLLLIIIISIKNNILRSLVSWDSIAIKNGLQKRQCGSNGKRKIILSDGLERERVNLARALYAESESVVQSCPTLCESMNYIAHQAPLPIKFSSQEYWSVLPFPSSGELPDPGIDPRLPALSADSLPSEPPEKPLYAELLLLNSN